LAIGRERRGHTAARGAGATRKAGQVPLTLPDGSERTFLEDGDEVILRGTGAPGEGRPPLTLAEVRGRIEPAA
jgi:hypothetical protein